MLAPGPFPRIFVRGMICALASIALVTGQSLDFPGEDENPDEEDSGGLLNADLMPDGGILKNVLIPQYDDNLALTATLRAEEMKIAVAKATEILDKTRKTGDHGKLGKAGEMVKPEPKKKAVQIKHIDAIKVQLVFFNPDRTPRGNIDMATARYDAKKELLTSKDPVSLVSDDLTASGSSLVYDLENTRGFLSGPVTATTKIDPSTSMNTRPVRQAIAAGTLMMAAAAPSPAQEEAPATPTVAERIAEARLSPEELARITKDSETGRPLVKVAADEGNAALEEATRRSENASSMLADFLSVATLTTLLAEPAVPSPSAAATDVPRPNLPEGPAKTRITADDGAFFDSKNGLLIFLKNVVVRDPRFSLTGADELKVFFDSPEETKAARDKILAKMQAKADAKAVAEGRDPEAERREAEKKAAADKEPAEKEESGLTDAKFGEPNKIIATGTVVVEYLAGKKDEGPVKASARTVVYDLKKEEFILRGGSPWIVRDGQISSVPGNDAYIVIKQDGSFVTGNGGIDAQMELKEEKKEDVNKNR